MQSCNSDEAEVDAVQGAERSRDEDRLSADVAELDCGGMDATGDRKLAELLRPELTSPPDHSSGADYQVGAQDGAR